MVTVEVQFNPIVILEGNGPTLFGGNWLSYIRLNWSDICHIGFGVEELSHIKISKVFSAQTGSLKGVQASISIHSDVTPKFLKPRSVPYNYVL